MDKSIPFGKKNLLISGDNLEALKLLQKNYTNQVDIIYIDPPYNTKNHKFTYRDTHQNWSEFMRLRLVAACGLLKDDGVVFISVDENESANLRLLCDEVFGAKNYITQFVWQKKNKPSFLHKKVSNMVEFVLCYAKDIKKAPLLSVDMTTKAKPYPLNFKNNPLSILQFPANAVSFGIKDKIVKKGEISTKSIQAVLLDDVEIQNGKNISGFRIQSEWRYNQKTLNELLRKGCELRVAKEPFRVNLIRKEQKLKPMHNLLSKESYNTPTYEDAHKEILKIFGFEAFSKPKPSGLIKLLLASVLHSKNDAIVLDFFAGSGTTAQAVFELNSSEHKKINFILVQSSEPVKPTSKAYQNDYKNIYEVCRARVQYFYKNLDNISEIKL